MISVMNYEIVERFFDSEIGTFYLCELANLLKKVKFIVSINKDNKLSIIYDDNNDIDIINKNTLYKWEGIKKTCKGEI